jgi:hypothetical protein
LRTIAEGVIRQKTPDAQADLTEFFTHYVSGTDEIPFEDILGHAGLAIRDTAPRHAAFGFSTNRTRGALPVIGETLYQVVELPEPSGKQRRIRDGILHGLTDVSR